MLYHPRHRKALHRGKARAVTVALALAGSTLGSPLTVSSPANAALTAPTVHTSREAQVAASAKVFVDLLGRRTGLVDEDVTAMADYCEAVIAWAQNAVFIGVEVGGVQKFMDDVHVVLESLPDPSTVVPTLQPYIDQITALITDLVDHPPAVIQQIVDAANDILGDISVDGLLGYQDGDLEAGITCQDMPIVSVENLLPDGTLAAPDATAPTGTGKRYLFDAGGYTVPQVVAPAGWNPLTATDAELATFGVEPRPTDPQALADWNAAYSHWTGSASPGMCQLLVSNFSSSPNWAGIANYSSNPSAFKRSSGTFVQPKFEAVCAHASSHSIWSGLGGDGTPHLMQSGTAPSQSSLNAIAAWWEAISPNFDTYQQNFTGLAISPGQTVRATTTYVPATSSAAGQATMSVYNVGTGKNASTGSIGSIDGIPISSFYNGATSEFVDERPTASGLKHPVDGHFFYLRKTQSSWTDWTQALSNGAGYHSFAYKRFYMIRSNGNLLEDAYAPSSGNNFDGYWDACA